MKGTLMKPARFISSGIVPLLLGTFTPAYAQQDRPGREDRPQKEEHQAKPEKKQKQEAPPARPQPQDPARGQRNPQQPQERRPAEPARLQQEQQRQQEAKQQQAARQHQEQQRQQQARQQEQRRQQQTRQPEAQQHQQEQAKRTSGQEPRRQETERRAIWQERRARNWRSEHRNWQQRGGYNGYRIPEDRYRAHFGPSRAFRLYRYPLIVFEGRPRFQFGGFWFTVMDPWPEYWSDTWYDNDDVYIDYSEDGYYLYNRRHPLDRIAISVSIQVN